MTSWKQVVALTGCVALVAFMLLGFLTVGEFLAASGVWLAAFALFGADIAEINLGTILGIKRDVRAAREIRNHVERQAEEIRAIRDQVQATESRVSRQAQSIEETSKRVAESEAQIIEMRDSLQEFAARVVEMVLLLVQIIGARRIMDNTEDKEELQKYTQIRREALDQFKKAFKGLTKVSTLNGERLILLLKEIHRRIDEDPQD